MVEVLGLGLHSVFFFFFFLIGVLGFITFGLCGVWGFGFGGYRFLGFGFKVGSGLGILRVDHLETSPQKLLPPRHRESHLSSP